MAFNTAVTMEDMTSRVKTNQHCCIFELTQLMIKGWAFSCLIDRKRFHRLLPKKETVNKDLNDIVQWLPKEKEVLFTDPVTSGFGKKE